MGKFLEYSLYKLTGIFERLKLRNTINLWKVILEPKENLLNRTDIPRCHWVSLNWARAKIGIIGTNSISGSSQMPGMSDLDPKWVRLAPNWKNSGIFQIRFVPFSANLTHFGPKSDISVRYSSLPLWPSNIDHWPYSWSVLNGTKIYKQRSTRKIFYGLNGLSTYDMIRGKTFPKGIMPVTLRC